MSALDVQTQAQKSAQDVAANQVKLKQISQSIAQRQTALDKQLSELTQANQDSKLREANYLQTIADLQLKLNDSEQKKQTYEAIAQKLESSQIDYQQITQANQELNKVYSDYKSREEQYQQTIADLEAKLSASEQTYQAIIQERNSSQADLQELQSQRQALQEQIEAGNIERERLSTELVTMNTNYVSERDQLRNETQAFNEARADLVQQIEGLQSQLADLRSEEVIIKEAQANCISQMQAATKAINQLQNERDTLAAQVEQTYAQLQVQAQQTEIARVAFAECESDKTYLNEQIKGLNDELKVISEDRNLLQRKILAMENEFINMLEKIKQY